MHLKPLRRQIEGLEEGEFQELEKRIPALYHVVCLIWAHSTHYQKPARLVVLMQEITNFLIELVSLFTSYVGEYGQTNNVIILLFLDP